ncbi:hypothetical protein Esti_005812 [Eimeria stiedai]
MQELQEDFYRSRSLCSHASTGFHSREEASCCGLAGFAHTHGAHKHATFTEGTNCTSAAVRECFACQQPQAADKWACQCAHGWTCQMHQEDMVVGAHLDQHPCCRHHCMWPPATQEARSCIESMPKSLAKEAGEEPVEYEYYVWDAKAQEYVQTDQKTGERMLQDPHYFQYHYKLVENSQHGEAHMVPERMDGGGLADYEEREYPSEVSLVDQEPQCFDRHQNGPGNEAGLAKHYRKLISKPAALVTPRKQSCASPSLAPHVGCLPEPALTSRSHHGIHERENHTFACEFKNRSKDSQLKHLQRVQQLEKEELLRRQLILDEMAASLPKVTKRISTSELKNRRSPLYLDDQISVRKPSRPQAAGSVSGGDRRLRNDPVNRGRYFRAKWKNDRFLEQQKHPAFDVKAYDAWLKSSGHLLRARALELQKEEQRLVSMLQQERKDRMRRCLYPS